MIENLHIRGYRRFRDFRMEGLSRVNLLVGRNNSGKSTVLEAVELLLGPQRGSQVFDVLTRRGERIVSDLRRHGDTELIDVCRLFTGFSRAVGTEASVSSNSGEATFAIEMEEWSADKIPPPQQMSSVDRALVESGASEIDATLTFSWRDDVRHTVEHQSVWQDGSVRRRTVDSGHESRRDGGLERVGSSSLTPFEIRTLLDAIALEDDESRVVDALRSLDPRVERIATIGLLPGFLVHERDGVILKLAGIPGRVPIGSLGDGVWRMLGLSLALVNAKGGTLLVDEIDTGLHYTALLDMWRMVLETAEALGVQVFATTHSSDCWYALAELIEERQQAGKDAPVALHRIEPDNDQSVPYTADEIRVAAQRSIEVR